MFGALLRPAGYLTQSAASGEAAIASIAVQAPDLILPDVMMPGMDGFAVARLLKSKPATSHIPIIMVTALADRSARLAGLKAGVEEFLTKPVDRAELWLRVRNLLRHERTWRPSQGPGRAIGATGASTNGAAAVSQPGARGFFVLGVPRPAQPAQFH
jgi:DNA-binding response OmpR family regulator